MAFALDITDVAVQDLEDLLSDIPMSRRPDAIAGVEAAMDRLVANPQLAQPRHLGRPTYHFSFVAGGVHYHWGCTYIFSEDETTIQVTHVFGVKM